MINGTRFKVCGLTSLVDAEAADACGADYLGFILYPKSPRYLPIEAFKAMARRLPDARKKVAVVVEPSSQELPGLLAAGFDLVQLHFSDQTPFSQIAAWAQAIPANKIWFAPRGASTESLEPRFFSLAETILLDAYDPNQFGGTGKTSNWAEFAALRQKYSRIQWVLAGGLSPENIGEAIRVTNAKIVDVNSGIEAAPGIKDHAKLRAFVLNLHKATVKNNPAYKSS